MADIYTKGGSFKEQAKDLNEQAARLEKEAKHLREKSKQKEFYGSGALDNMLGYSAMDDDEKDAKEIRHEAEDLEVRAHEYRQRAKELNEAPIESVMDDIGPQSYSKPKPKKTVFRLPRTRKGKAVAAAGVVIIAGAALYFSFTDKQKEGTQAPLTNVGKYYRVLASDPAGDTGTEVCARAGLECVGYTDLTLTTCKAFHPGAKTSEDLNGSRAGFYCNGPPQGGICATETDTCHICPKCNLNMQCDTVIGDLYRETFVECR